MAGQVSCRKLKRLVLGPYQMAVLCQGVLRRADQDEVGNTDVLVGMEYSGAVGTMVIDELVEVNGRVSSAVDQLKEKAEVLEQDQEDLDGCLEAEKERVWELEEWIVHIELERHVLHQEVQSVKASSANCILQMVELMTEVWALQLFQTSLQHGPGNPIVVEDDEEVEETENESSDFNGDAVVFPDVG